MLTKSFALELAGKGIRCNLVSPGSTRTEMLIQTWSDRYGESETIQGDISKFRLGIPLNKIAEPVDIAKSVSFLLSDDANHITMHDLRVDGGATLSQ
jgi:2,3-dihydro-2,3-dihydroxybenzoate dehydrogenase